MAGFISLVAAAALGYGLYYVASNPQVTHPRTQRYTEEARFGGVQVPMKAFMDNARINPNNGIDGELQIYGDMQRFSVYGSPDW